MMSGAFAEWGHCAEAGPFREVRFQTSNKVAGEYALICALVSPVRVGWDVFVVSIHPP